MRIKSFIQLILLVNLMLTCFMFLVNDTNSWVDLESLVYLFLLSGVLSLSLTYTNLSGLPLLLLLVIYTFQKYCLSPIYLILLQLETNSTPFLTLSNHSSSDYNAFLRYSFLGFTATATGLILGTKSRLVFDNSKILNIGSILKDRLSGSLNFFVIALYLSFITAIYYYEYYIIGGQGFLVHEGESKWYRIFLRGTPIIHLSFSLLLFNWETLRRRDKSLLISLLLFVGLLSILSGARSYIYVMSLLLIICYAIKYGNYKIENSWIGIISLIGFLGVISYPIATAYRYASRIYASKGETPTIENVFQTFDWLYSTSTNLISNILVSILTRLSSIETGLIIMNDKIVNPLGDLLSVSIIFKRILNDLWPGSPFPEAMKSQYLFDHIYFDKFIGFNAHDWGLWEQYYLIFGYWGGLFCMFFSMICVGQAWNRLLYSKSHFKTFYLTNCIFFLWMMFLNFDVSYVFSSFLRELIVFNIMIRILITGTKLSTIFKLRSFHM
jgi:hypothetical protein